MGKRGFDLVSVYIRGDRTWDEVLTDLGHKADGTPIKPGAPFLAEPRAVRDPKRYFQDLFITVDGVRFIVSREWTTDSFAALKRREVELRKEGKLPDADLN